MEKKWILSLDIGFKRLGWASWLKEFPPCLEGSGCFLFRDREDGEPFNLYRDLGLLNTRQIMESVFKYGDFTDVVVESFPLNNLQFQRALGAMTLAVVRSEADRFNVNWHEIPAQEIKHYITGNRKATKAQMRRKVAELYPSIKDRDETGAEVNRKLTSISFDEIDAIATGETWLNRDYKWQK